MLCPQARESDFLPPSQLSARLLTCQNHSSSSSGCKQPVPSSSTAADAFRARLLLLLSMSLGQQQQQCCCCRLRLLPSRALGAGFFSFAVCTMAYAPPFSLSMMTSIHPSNRASVDASLSLSLFDPILPPLQVFIILSLSTTTLHNNGAMRIIYEISMREGRRNTCVHN